MHKYLSSTIALAAVLTTVGITANPAQAVITTFTNFTDWSNAVSGTQTEDFQAQPLIDPIPNNTVYNVGLFDVFYTTLVGIDETSNEVHSS